MSREVVFLLSVSLSNWGPVCWGMLTAPATSRWAAMAVQAVELQGTAGVGSGSGSPLCVVPKQWLLKIYS